jgi:hypothetical protein
MAGQREKGLDLLAVCVATLFLAVICGLAARDVVPLAVPAVYLAASAAAGVACRRRSVSKIAAVERQRRER